MPIPVILDTDIGSDIDDTWALVMLLNCPELAPKLIVTAVADVRFRAHLTAKFLHVVGRTDVPIGIGIENGRSSPPFQKPWLDGYDVSTYPGVLHEDGVRAMIDTIMASPDPVTVISIAPATNIARALELEPRIAEKCRFVGMHGSVVVGYNGYPKQSIENNVMLDIPALRKVFAAPWIEKTITPLDTCGTILLEGERYRRIYESPDPMLKALIENYQAWAKVVSGEANIGYTERGSSTLFDTVAVYLAYARDLLNIEPIRLAITDQGFTDPDPAGDEIQVAMTWRDKEAFYDHLVERLQNRAI
jgi:inosine-uridine nucleoside N-ribohydrolase